MRIPVLIRISIRARSLIDFHGALSALADLVAYVKSFSTSFVDSVLGSLRSFLNLKEFDL